MKRQTLENASKIGKNSSVKEGEEGQVKNISIDQVAWDKKSMN